MPPFKVHAPYVPTGDQPRAIAQLVEGLQRGLKHQTLLGATGTGKSLGYDEPVFVVEQQGDSATPRVVPIGELIDTLLDQAPGRLRFDGETTLLDTTTLPAAYYTQSFDPATGEVGLYRISAFTRHAAPASMYRLQTACGRSAVLTGDHNLWVLRDGRLALIETADARPTDCIPLPESLLAETELETLDIVSQLGATKLCVQAHDSVLAFADHGGRSRSIEAVTAYGSAGYHKLDAIKRGARGAGLQVDLFQQLLKQTGDLGGYWDSSTARVGGKASRCSLPADLQLSPAFLRLVGYYIAGGHYQHGCITIANPDAVVRSDIEQTLCQLGLPFGLGANSDYQISSTALAELLQRLCGVRARDKHLPPFWPQLSRSALGALLSAYCDGDATVERASAVTMTTASRQLASELAYALMRFGIWARIRRVWKRATDTAHAGAWYYLLTISGQADLRRFTAQIGFSIPDKQQALAKLLQRNEHSNVDVVPIQGQQLRWLRKQLNLTATQLGAAAGLSRAAIQMIELNGRQAQRRNLRATLLALRATADQLNPGLAWWQTWQALYGLCQLRWTPIELLEPVEYQHPFVYDFSVPGPETFLGGHGGLFVHNTYVMAEIIEQVQRPTLILAHNKTLAAQLYSEFKEFFPDNAVAYFVSYYDQYTPEAYVPSKDLYIEKEASINEEIDRLRHEATQALLTRRDVVIVASVSAIYGLGAPADYGQVMIPIRAGEVRNRDKLLRQLIDLQFERNDIDFHRGTFRVRGDTVEIFPANAETALRIEFWGDEIDRIVEVDPLTGELLVEKRSVDIFPAKHFITTHDKLQLAIQDIQVELEERLAQLEAEGKNLEAQRLKQRTLYDLEMLSEMGYCSGVENYSRHLDRRGAGQTPWTLLDYFPDDFLLFIDESHISLPQVRGMFKGDRSRKGTLVDYGFRLPSALDNRPLQFEEFVKHIHQAIYVSATPSLYELEQSEQIVEQIIRPTGLLDPVVQVRPTRGQIDDLLAEVRIRVTNGQRALVTTLTKRMAEDLADYLKEMGIRTHYLHADIDTIERVEILRDLRLGIYDVVVGINLLREGLDLPEVSLVAILDADKEGYLRSESALIQTMGRAARHLDGTVIMYADAMTRSMEAAIRETQRRRAIQEAHNREHGIEPQSIIKEVRDLTDRLRHVAEQQAPYGAADGSLAIPKDELARLIKDLEKQMKEAARNLEFEKAALLRDQVVELRRTLALEDEMLLFESASGRRASAPPAAPKDEPQRRKPGGSAGRGRRR